MQSAAVVPSYLMTKCWLIAILSHLIGTVWGKRLRKSQISAQNRDFSDIFLSNEIWAKKHRRDNECLRHSNMLLLLKQRIQTHTAFGIDHTSWISCISHTRKVLHKKSLERKHMRTSPLCRKVAFQLRPRLSLSEYTCGWVARPNAYT